MKIDFSIESKGLKERKLSQATIKVYYHRSLRYFKV